MLSSRIVSDVLKVLGSNFQKSKKIYLLAEFVNQSNELVKAAACTKVVAFL